MVCESYLSRDNRNNHKRLSWVMTPERCQGQGWTQLVCFQGPSPIPSRPDPAHSKEDMSMPFLRNPGLPVLYALAEKQTLLQEMVAQSGESPHGIFTLPLISRASVSPFGKRGW